MSLHWRCIGAPGRADWVAEPYRVRDATVWEHSRVKQFRTEAVCGETHLGFFPTGREAIEACEQHFKENQRG